MIRFVNVMMAIVFLLSVAVQYNDPDGPIWMAVYGAAAGMCILYVMGRLRWQIAAVLAVIAGFWSLTLLPTFAGRVTLAELFGSFTMKTEAIEVAREAGGLLIVCTWMVILAFVTRKSPSEPESA